MTKSSTTMNGCKVLYNKLHVNVEKYVKLAHLPVMNRRAVVGRYIFEHAPVTCFQVSNLGLA